VTKDIGPILNGWPHEPGQVTVRKVRGVDGKIKIQLRVDLGLLQMESAGRPDGQRPYGCESMLGYLQKLLRHHRRAHGSGDGFALNPEQCELLRAEAAQFYYRYLSEFVLGEYKAVVRDTGRNLDAMDFCRRYAAEDDDREAMEQYRPYILMMNTRGRAHLALRGGRLRAAREAVRLGIKRIRKVFGESDEEELAAGSSELATLAALLREIESKMPVDPVEQLQRKLAKAVEEERYEEAARLRDLIRAAANTDQQ